MTARRRLILTFLSFTFLTVLVSAVDWTTEIAYGELTSRQANPGSIGTVYNYGSLLRLAGIVVGVLLSFRYGRPRAWTNMGVVAILFSALFSKFSSAGPVLIIGLNFFLGLIYPYLFIEFFSGLKEYKKIVVRATQVVIAFILGAFLFPVILGVVFPFFENFESREVQEASEYILISSLIFFIPVIITTGLVMRGEDPLLKEKMESWSGVRYATPQWALVAYFGFNMLTRGMYFVFDLNELVDRRMVDVVFQFGPILSLLLAIAIFVYLTNVKPHIDQFFRLTSSSVGAFVALSIIAAVLASFRVTDILGFVLSLQAILHGLIQILLIVVCLTTIFNHLHSRLYLLGLIGFYLAYILPDYILDKTSDSSIIWMIGLLVSAVAWYELRKVKSEIPPPAELLSTPDSE